MLQKRNEEINIISKETAKNYVIRERHIVDSAQIIDFVDFFHALWLKAVLKNLPLNQRL